MSEPWSEVCDGCRRNASECSCQRDKHIAVEQRLARATELLRRLAIVLAFLEDAENNPPLLNANRDFKAEWLRENATQMRKAVKTELDVFLAEMARCYGMDLRRNLNDTGA